MNDLEEAIIQGAVGAEKAYERLADGHWLSHAHESFLQALVALKVRKLGNFVYIDASIKKMQRDQERRRRGRPRGQRYS